MQTTNAATRIGLMCRGALLSGKYCKYLELNRGESISTLPQALFRKYGVAPKEAEA
jgi:hypothetical protein